MAKTTQAEMDPALASLKEAWRQWNLAVQGAAKDDA